MPSPWGAALESLGSGLMKFGMMKSEQEQDLAKEERTYQRALALDAAKEEAKAAREAAVQKARGERFAAAQTKGEGLLTSQLDKQVTGLTELQRLRGEAAKTWEAYPEAPQGPTIRSQTTEAEWLRDLRAEERAAFGAGLDQAISEAKAVKPAQKDIDEAALRELIVTNPDDAEALLKLWETKAKIAKMGREDPDKSTKIHVSGGYVYQEQDDGTVKRLFSGDKGTGDGKPTAKQRDADAAANKLRSLRVTLNDGSVRHLTREEFGELASWVSRESPKGEDPLANAPKWVANTIKQNNGPKAMQELMKDAAASSIQPWSHGEAATPAPASKPAAAAQAPSSQTDREQYNAAVAAANKIADPAKRAGALKELEAAARKAGVLK